MKDYSQDREQLAVFDLLGTEEHVRLMGTQNARVLELGAWNARTFSNSRALIECGWKATLVEPSPGPMYGLVKEYGDNPSVTLIQAAIGLEPGYVKMHITDDAVSTSDDATFEAWRGQTKFIGSLHVPVLTLEDLAHRFGGGHVWSVDCEGLSVDIFHRMMALNITPPVVIVEFDQRMPELLQAATSRGYRMTFSNATNVVLAR